MLRAEVLYCYAVSPVPEESGLVSRTKAELWTIQRGGKERT